MKRRSSGIAEWKPERRPTTVAAKFALYTAMREQGVTATELTERLNLDEQAIKKLLNPLYRSHITTVRRALAVVGRELIVEDCAVATPPEAVAIGSES